MKKQNRILMSLLCLLGFVTFLSNNCKKDATTSPLTCNGSGYFYSFDTTTRMIFPNAFTPDGTGPLENETFGGVGRGFFNFSLTIKDLSGTTLFFDSVITKRWDGKNLNGKIVEGYYIAYISFQNFAGATINKTMDITLYYNTSTKFLGECKFGDMINPLLGFIYPTQEALH